MLIQPTIENLKTLKLFGMVRALESQLASPDTRSLSFEERLGLLVDSQLSWQDDKRLQYRLKAAKLPVSATIEDFDARGGRGIDRSAISALATSDWVLSHQNVIIIGLTGVGKSYLACALAQKACRDGFSAAYFRASRLFQELALAKADGRYATLLATIARKDLLVIDDFGLSGLTGEQARDLLEVIEDRYDRKSTLISSQVPVDHWHQLIGDPTVADAVLDRVVHISHKITLKGESRRKQKAKELQLVG
jgi:DNA replication protein DnaC